MRRLLLALIAVAGVVGAAALVAVYVQWQGHVSGPQLGPSEAQQNRAQQQAVRRSVPPQQLSEAQIRRYQEQLDAAGFPTGPEKGTITAQTEAALRAYQEKYGLPATRTLDEATQRSLAAGRTPTPGKTTEGESVPGGTAPSGSPR
jgi:peptidoglycan hydrolase-like protein with peptidoglycan-binding domain